MPLDRARRKICRLSINVFGKTSGNFTLQIRHVTRKRSFASLLLRKSISPSVVRRATCDQCFDDDDDDYDFDSDNDVYDDGETQFVKLENLGRKKIRGQTKRQNLWKFIAVVRKKLGSAEQLNSVAGLRRVRTLLIFGRR